MRDSMKTILFYSPTALVSIYLTFLADAFLSLPVAGRIAVFCLSLALSVFVLWFYRRQAGQTQRPAAFTIAAITAALLATALLQNVWLPQSREQRITLTANADGAAGEVWLAAVMLDGTSVQLSQLEDVESENWIYHAEYDDYIHYPGEDTVSNHLAFSVRAESVTLRFSNQPWCGSVTITDDAGHETLLPLSGTAEGRDYSEFTCAAPAAYRLGERLLYSAGTWLLLAFFLRWALEWLFAHVDHRRYLCLGLYLLLAAALFTTSYQISPTPGTLFFLAVFTLVCGWGSMDALSHPAMRKYHSTARLAALCGVALYGALACFFHRFFLQGNVRMYFSTIGSFYILLASAWFVPVVYSGLYAMERLSSAPRGGNAGRNRRADFWKLLALLCLCMGGAVAAFWPGGFPPDNIDQLMQIIGVYPYNDWHPVMHTLAMKAVYSVFHNIGMIPMVQAFFFCLLCAKFLMLAYDRGVSYRLLCILGCVFVLLPNQVLSAVCPEKDYAYMLALLWGTYLLLRLAMDIQVVKKPLYLASLALDLVLIFGMRHNGVLPFGMILLLLLWLTIRYYKVIRLRLIPVMLAAVSLVAVYKGPVFSALNVSPNAVSVYTTMLCAMGSCVNKDLPLSEETNEMLETVLPLEDWRDYYSRFHGHDIYYWGRSSDIAYDTSQITGTMAFSMYFEALWKYPDVVIKDRLDGANLMWDVTQPYDSFNLKILDWVNVFDLSSSFVDTEKLEKAPHGDYYNRSFIAELYRKASYTPPNHVADMLLWRTGAYLILGFTLALFLFANKMKRFFWVSVPLLANIVCLTLVLYHQSFRYVYLIQVLTLAMLFAAIVTKETPQEDTYESNCGTDPLLQ